MKKPRLNNLPVLLTVIIILAYAIFFSWLSILQHNRFATGGGDLGNFDQAVWNTLHGRILQFTNVPQTNSRLGLHFEPILIPLSLAYLVWSDALTLIKHPGTALQLLLSNPDKVRYLTHLTAPVAFLALLDIPTLLPVLPVVALNLLSEWSPTYVLDRFHYSAPIVPFVVFAAINGMKRLIGWLTVGGTSHPALHWWY